MRGRRGSRSCLCIELGAVDESGIQAYLIWAARDGWWCIGQEQERTTWDESIPDLAAKV